MDNKLEQFKMGRYYTCEHDLDIIEGSVIECDTVEDGAIIYAHMCGDTSLIHIVYAHDSDTLTQESVITLRYEMSDFKIVEVQECQTIKV